METITLRDIPATLARRIAERADRSGTSLDQTVIEMLTEKSDESLRAPHLALDHLVGTWSPEEADAFDAELAFLRTVDHESKP